MHNSLNITYSAHNLTFSNKFGSHLVVIVLLSFIVSVLTSVPQQLVPLSPPSFILSSLSLLQAPKSQITRLQQIQNSLAHAVVKAPKSCHITPPLTLCSRTRNN